MTSYIQKLPTVFQTQTEKNFFSATFDQVLSKKDSDLLAGYIGRRIPGQYNPISDFYLPEPTKNRTWWQLEATAFARDENSAKTNIFFYDDLLEKIEYYGGNTLNQDRLFESEYYSFGPPIDFDMFTNYQNYYWVEQGLPSITIRGIPGNEIFASQIIGQPSYTTPYYATPAGLKLTTGMSIILLDDPAYSLPHYVEFVDGCEGIRLVPISSDFTAGSLFEFLPWDGTIQLSTGRIIVNDRWDSITWDTQTQPTTGDYITIERGSLDKNAWSRTNRWFHLDVINQTMSLTGTAFPTNATRALRPIIQFTADLILFNSGTQFRSEIQYGFRDDLLGLPITLSSLDGRLLSTVNDDFDIQMEDGDLIVFFNDNTPFDFWDVSAWDSSGDEWDSGIGIVNQFIFEVIELPDSTVTFQPYTSNFTPILEGDIVFITEDGPFNAAQRGQTWYFSQGVWQEVFNDKISLNQAPLFQLYDHNGVKLNDMTTYPESTFSGSKVFSYKVNAESGATVDPVLKFPILYSGLGQALDIIFQNNLITDRYTYGLNRLPIDGYYYYKTSVSPVLYNNWNLYNPCPCGEESNPQGDCNAISKQRVIDKFVVGYGSEFQFKLSVTPFSYSSTDLIVSVNGKEIMPFSAEVPLGYIVETINNRIYITLNAYLTMLLETIQVQSPVVEVQTYTHDLLDPSQPGYFEIPQQLDANPGQLEVFDISGSDLTKQFTSIIKNQIGFRGSSFGGSNNYRDTEKNRSLGNYILQNVTPALKSMLISSSTDLDFISSLRFSQDEYTKFKNKYLQVALQLINRGFNPVQYHNNTIVISQWVEEILKIVNISKEFSNAFAYSYMIANGSPFASEPHPVPIGGNLLLTNYIDLSDPKNALYVYDVSGQEELLVLGQDYEVISDNLVIEVQINTTRVSVGTNLVFTFYKNPLPAYIPSTPTKVGAYSAYLPRIEMDESYVIPTNVIIGHDGSKTLAYGDYRDLLLLELEKRIYNLLQYKFRNQYCVPLRIEDVKPGKYRETRYSREEYLGITESYLNKWTAKNRANYRANDWASASLTSPTSELWKLYNYRDAVDTSGIHLNLPGNWKGIFQYYYDTYYPDTRPWEMLGFSQQPSWWVSNYGPGVVNLAGQRAWPSTNSVWGDISNGIIREGPSAIFDPDTLSPQPQEMWIRDGLIIPVDSSGELIPVMNLFDVAFSGNLYAPFDGFDKEWIYGDGSPVEQAWMSTSSYAFNIQEFLYLMRPATYSEYMWDTVGTELSPGTLNLPAISSPVRSNNNWQYVQNDFYSNDDPFFKWMRPKNQNQIVHAENIENNIEVRFGYQRWISDMILFLGKDVTSTFGQKIRTLDVNLANKFAGFTNKDTTNIYIESVSPNASTNTLIIPSNNFDVFLHTSPIVETYAYSGVIVRALADGTFAIYGYDLLKSEFIILDRSTDKLIDITIGGTPSPFKYFTSGETYTAGDIVRYNGVYYLSLVTQLASKFESTGWQKLNGLPTIGGISVSYKPYSNGSITRLPYGSVLKNPQEVFDFLIGWGAYLESIGWKFDEVNQDTNELNNWLTSAKQYLFWLNTEWAPDASIQLSPLANSATLIVARGYPSDVESMSNGVYNILDKFGIAISPNNTTVERDGRQISVSPSTLSAGGIYFLQVNTFETEHVLIFDNTTSFNDVLYSPLLRMRQERLRFNGFRSNGWYGKMEAPGYLVIGDQLVPNFDTIVENMRYFYDPNVTIDNPSLEDLGRHLIGYESKSYLDNLQVSNNIQYLFYQGAIRQKGTAQSFDKLFRSTVVQHNEVISVFEEWALKLGDFGNSVEQVSTEFILTPEQNIGEVLIARLNYIPSHIGFVKQINILNAQNTYNSIPKIIITPPDADELDAALTEPVRQAKAYAILDTDGKISRIDITDVGYGYLSAPYITIDSGIETHNLDKLYSVWQGEIVKDETLDNIVNIDIDQTDRWTVRPNNPELTLKLPTTSNINYSIPNAGYVNFNDVDWTSFDVLQTAVNWGTTILNPAENDTVWIAKTFSEDWNVFKMVNIVPQPYLPNNWKVTKDDSGNLLLLTTYSTNPLFNLTIIPQLWLSTTGERTEFNNMVVLQQVTDGKVNVDNNYTVGITPYITDDYNAPGIFNDPDTLLDYNAYSLVTLDNIPITTDNIGTYQDLNTLLLFKSMRWTATPVPPLLPVYVGIGDLVWVDNISNSWAVLKLQANPGAWNSVLWDLQVIDFWSPNYGWDVTGPLYFTPHRIQEQLLNTSLFESAEVFAGRDGNELVLLPIYDPFKDILPGPAKQNIAFMSLQDPARYNITGSTRLFSNNITFGEKQIGQLWWDLSSTRYVYYEQPTALDGSETIVENLIYRRDRWGQIFPGSTINIYEWVKSPVPPEDYVGTGTPRDITSYVRLVTSNKFTNITEINYYFWVLNTTDKPNIENRTLTALDVSRLLQSPKSQGFAFFAPIQQTDTNNSYMFYNVQEILAYKGDNIQITYRLSERDDQSHTQWAFFREGDPGCIVTDQFWNKMVDSLCGYTRVLPMSDEFTNGIPVAKFLPWDIYGWDIATWDSATTSTTPLYGEILPVPDPTLSESEKFGIEYRPRQGMFSKIFSARKVFVQSANNLLKHIPIRDNNPEWNIDVSTDEYWDYTNWYEIGYDDAVPNVVFQTLIDANTALVAGQLMLGDIVQVTNGTIDGRFILYAVVQLNPNVSTLSLDKIGIQNSAINLLSTIYTSNNLYGLSVELRELLNAFRLEVMIDANKVDQNELFFSMMNYVLSEQKNPDWLFKSSYIYIKENNIPLTQNQLFVPDQIDNIINYIIDSKPYHTQIRDYTSSYVTADITAGIASDTSLINIDLAFGPDNITIEEEGNWDTACNDSNDSSEWGPVAWDNYAWDVCAAPTYILDAKLFTNNIQQFVSREDVYTVPLTVYDPSKRGYSQLFPYTFNFNSLNHNNPQTFITPHDIVAVMYDGDTLIYGQDYYVEYNNDTTYTAYFYNELDPLITPVALVWFNGGGMQHFRYNTKGNEIAYGFPTSGFVVNVDTQLPANTVSGTVRPYVGWGDVWDEVDGPVADAIIDAGGSASIAWDAPLTLVMLPNIISYKESIYSDIYHEFYRNAHRFEGQLLIDLPAPTSPTENTDVITVYVDPDTHPITTYILPDPISIEPVAIWIGGERIEYKVKELIAPNTWELRLIRRGTNGTAPVDHSALIPSLADPLVLVPNPVWVESFNSLAIESNEAVWNILNEPAIPDLLTETSPNEYTSVSNIPIGGLWYSYTDQAEYLKDEQGVGIP